MKDLNANDLEAAIADHRRLRPLDGPRGGGVATHGEAYGKRHEGLSRAVDRDKLLSAGRGDAAWSRTSATAKFDETVEVAMNLGVDPRHADQMVRGVVNLPQRHRQDRARRRVRPRRQGRGSQGGRRRHRRRRGPGREDPGRRDRLRPRHRHPGHDGAWSAGSARCSARAA